MSTPYDQLLEATIRHLEHLKAQGVRFLPASPAAPGASAEAAPVRVQRSALPQAVRNEARPNSISSQITPQPTVSSTEVLPLSAQPSGGPIASPSQLSPAALAKAQAMAELRERALACVKCPHLVASRKQVVFGVGDINASLMFIGEAPGADEDVQGEPFVGKAGQLLTLIIKAMGFTREAVYIANILKCRPDTLPHAAGNRKPTPPEMETCIPYLHQQIDLIQPKVIVALGATAVEGLLGKTLGITKLRGQWRTYREIPLMPTFHPSYLLRPENANQKRSVWEDMLQVMEKLALPISDKQRDYFLKR